MPWRSAEVLSRAVVIRQTFMGILVATATGDTWPARSYGAGSCPFQYPYRVSCSLAWRQSARPSRLERPQFHVLNLLQSPTVVALPDRGRGGDLCEPSGTGSV